MPAVAGDVYQVRVLANDATVSQLGVNVMHYHCFATTGASVSLNAVCSALDAAWATQYKAWMAVDANYRGTGLKEILPAQLLEVADTSRAGAGTSGGTSLPAQVSGIITFKTLFTGRSKRGRIYPPFPSDTFHTVHGEMSAGGIAALDAIRAAIPLTLVVGGGGNTASVELVIWHRKTKTFDSVTSASTPGKWATQRRRGDYGRPNTVFPF